MLPRMIPNSAEYRRYAEVARQVANEEQGLDRLWIELALFWENVAEYRAAEEAQLPGRQQPR